MATFNDLAGIGVCAHCRTGIVFVKPIGWLHTEGSTDHDATPASDVPPGTTFRRICTGTVAAGGHVSHSGPCPMHEAASRA